MFSKIVLLTVLLVGVNCRYLLVEDYEAPLYLIENPNQIDDVTGHENVEPISFNARVRRGAVSVGVSNDGGVETSANVPLAGNDKNLLSATGSLSNKHTEAGLLLENANGHSLSVSGKHIPDFGDQLTAAGKANLLHTDKHDLSANAFITKSIPNAPGASSSNAYGGGLDYLHKDGHSLGVSGQHIPNIGEQLTAAGKANLLHTDKHDLSANAFITRNMPSAPRASDFNSYGGGLDYTFNKRLGASLGVTHTPIFKQTDLSAMGKFNLHRDPTSSLDFSAGASRSFSPYMPRSSWEPKLGFSFTKWF